MEIYNEKKKIEFKYRKQRKNAAYSCAKGLQENQNHYTACNGIFKFNLMFKNT